MTNGMEGKAWARKDRLTLAQRLRLIRRNSAPTTFLISNQTQQAMINGGGAECALDEFDGENSIFIQSFAQPHPRSFRNATFSRTYCNTIKRE